MRKTSTGLILLAPLAAISILLVVACGFILIQSLGWVPVFGLQELSFSYYLTILQDESFLTALSTSLYIAASSSLIAAVLGTLLCAALTMYKKPTGLMSYIVRFPLLIPHSLVALFTILLFSQTGLIARLSFELGFISDFSQFPQLLFSSGDHGTILAYIWKEIPFVAYFSFALMSSISERLGQAASNLGASGLKSFFYVTLPLSLPSIAKASLIIFIFSFASYELPLLLGATLPKALPVEAYLAYLSPELKDRPQAMAMYGLIFWLSMALSALYALLMHRLLKRLGRTDA